MNVINAIIAKDRVLGDLARESKECADENKYMAALACLFLLVEHAIKQVLDKNEGNLSDLTKMSREKGFITNDEFLLIERLRELRNKLFHENHYSWHIEKSGIYYPFSEDETKKLIFGEFSDKCFDIVLKLT